jgi:hypothetical protein
MLSVAAPRPVTATVANEETKTVLAPFARLHRTTWLTWAEGYAKGTLSIEQRLDFTAYLGNYLASLCAHGQDALDKDWLSLQNADLVVVHCGEKLTNHPLLQQMFHLQQLTEDLLAAGTFPSDAAQTQAQYHLNRRLCAQLQSFFTTLAGAWVDTFGYPPTMLRNQSMQHLHALWTLLRAKTQVAFCRHVAHQWLKEHKQQSAEIEQELARLYWMAVRCLGEYDVQRQGIQNCSWMSDASSKQVRAEMRAWARPFYHALGDWLLTHRRDRVHAECCFVFAAQADPKVERSDTLGRAIWSKTTRSRREAQKKADALLQQLNEMAVAPTTQLPLSLLDDQRNELTSA